MRRARLVVAAATVLVGMTACGPEVRVTGDAAGGGTPVRVRGQLERADSGWTLCPGHQPPCWSIANADGWELSADYVIAEGELERGSFTLMARPEPVDDSVTFPNPCPDVEPIEGDGDTTLEEIVDPYAREIADEYAGGWYARSGAVFVFAVLRNGDHHRRQLAERGMTRGICVIDEGFRYTAAELDAVLDEVVEHFEEWERRGWYLASGSTDTTNNRVEVSFDQVDSRLTATIADTWGNRVVVEGIIEVIEGTVDDIDEGLLPSEVPIATKHRGGSTMAALGHSVLRYDAESDCVYLGGKTGGERTKPVWPFGYRALRDPVRVVNGRGEVVATVDEEFQSGGGQGPLEPDDPLACGASTAWTM